VGYVKLKKLKYISDYIESRNSKKVLREEVIHSCSSKIACPCRPGRTMTVSNSVCNDTKNVDQNRFMYQRNKIHTRTARLSVCRMSVLQSAGWCLTWPVIY